MKRAAGAGWSWHRVEVAVAQVPPEVSPGPGRDELGTAVDGQGNVSVLVGDDGPRRPERILRTDAQLSQRGGAAGARVPQARVSGHTGQVPGRDLLAEIGAGLVREQVNATVQGAEQKVARRV